jgi:hypothetical protein
MSYSLLLINRNDTFRLGLLLICLKFLSNKYRMFILKEFDLTPVRAKHRDLSRGRMQESVLASYGSVQGPVTSCCESGNEPTGLHMR